MPLFGFSRLPHVIRFPYGEGGQEVEIEKIGLPILARDYFMFGGGVVSVYDSLDELLASLPGLTTDHCQAIVNAGPSLKLMYDARSTVMAIIDTTGHLTCDEVLLYL
jgi:hypothetical protein